MRVWSHGEVSCAKHGNTKARGQGGLLGLVVDAHLVAVHDELVLVIVWVELDLVDCRNGTLHRVFEMLLFEVGHTLVQFSAGVRLALREQFSGAVGHFRIWYISFLCKKHALG